MNEDVEDYHAPHCAADAARVSRRPSSSWTLVREIGLEYSQRAGAGESIALQSPIAAERTVTGGHLIVDDEAADFAPARLQCRTLLLSTDGEIAFDSKALGLEDAYGCLMDGNEFALLRRARSELCVLSHSGAQIRRLDLSKLSRRKPKMICWTPRGTFLVAFLAVPRELDLVELDCRGRVLWSCVESISTVGIPSSMQLLGDGSIVIADEFHHVVWKLSRNGSSAILWGRWHSPAASDGSLHRPRSAHLLRDGTLLIADAHNSRILAVDRAGRAAPLKVKNQALFSPSCVRRLKNGNYLVCDAVSRCVFEMDARGRVSPLYGALKVRARSFSFPRSVQYLGGSRYLVADTARNAIVSVTRAGMREHPASRSCALFWPRAARMTETGNVLIADGRRSRVLESSPKGAQLRQLKQCRHQDRFLTFQDPHDVRVLPNQNLLIVDSPQNLVVETDWGGRAAWFLGADSDFALRDPHSAQQLPDGRILISDTYNHRILFFDPRTRSTESIREIREGATRCTLFLPRYAEVAPDGTLAIADSGNNRILLTDLEFRSVSVLAEVPQSPIPTLRFPRWVQPLTRNELVISDHGNHRVLHLRRSPN